VFKISEILLKVALNTINQPTIFSKNKSIIHNSVKKNLRNSAHQTIVFLYQAKGMLISDSSGCNLLPGKIK
jgi:hypothetical protein